MLLWIVAGSFAVTAPLYLLFIVQGCLFRLCAFAAAMSGAALAGASVWWALRQAATLPADLLGVAVAIAAYLAVAELFVRIGQKGKGEG